jgi:hypothetical protein
VPSPTVPPPPAYPSGYGAAPSTNGFAVASLVLGIVGIACCVGWILALVFGSMARNQIDQSYGRQTGRGLATAGIVLGWVSGGLTIAYLIVMTATGSL